MIPEAIQQGLARRTVARPRADRPIASGDIRRASSGGVERLVLVLKVNSQRMSAQVTLVHPYTECATDDDILIEPSVSGVAYPVVVEAGMRGVVWLKDLDRLVALVPRKVVDACLGSRTTMPTGQGLSVGTRYSGPLEARADFKSAERSSLARLCEDCTAAALSDEADVYEIACDEVFMALLEPSPHAGSMIEAILNLWLTKGEDLVFTLEHVEFLYDRDLLSVDRWESALGSDGRAFRLGPLQDLIDRAMARSGIVEPNATVRLGTKELTGAGTGGR